MIKLEHQKHIYALNKIVVLNRMLLFLIHLELELLTQFPASNDEK